MIVILAVLFVGLLVFAFREKIDNDEVSTGICATCIVIAVLLSVFILLDYADANSMNASRDSLVESYQNTPSTSDEDIAGKVADFNVRLSKAKYWRGVPVIGGLRAGKWDSMEPIQIKQRQDRERKPVLPAEPEKE